MFNYYTYEKNKKKEDKELLEQTKSETIKSQRKCKNKIKISKK